MNMVDVKEALEYGSKNTGGAAALFTEGRNPEKWEEIRNSPYYKDILNEILESGEKFLKSPIRTLPFSLYKIFEQTGSRKEYEKEYFERRGRLNTFAVLSLVYGRKEYIGALEDVLWAICDEYTWSLPAHLGGHSLSIIEDVNARAKTDGKVKPSIWEHSQTVDLFAAETGFALAEILSLLEGKLSPLVVYRARNEIRKRILEPYCEMNTPFWWESYTNNWAAVCAGSVGAAAMYLIEDDAMLAPIIARLMDTMECFLSGYEADGACTEGLGYWNYGFGFFTAFASLLKQRTGGKIDLFNSEKVWQIALFQQKCFLSENKIISFSDGSVETTYRKGLTHYLKSLYEEVEIPDEKYAAGFHADHCYRWSHSIRDLVWSNSSYPSGRFGEATYYLEDSQWFIARKVLGDHTVCFVAKGGHNNEPHNHNDVGNFLLHADGETLLADTGAGEYTKQYFGPERYTFFCNSSEGHSVPVIEGRYQSVGAEYRAKILEVKTSKECDRLSMDIAKAYDSKNLKSLVRSFTFDKTGDTLLRITDSFNFESAPSSVTERFISFHKPEVGEKGKVRLSGKRAGVDILFDEALLECRIGQEVFMNHRAAPVDIYTIDLIFRQTAPSISAEVVFMVNCEK